MKNKNMKFTATNFSTVKDKEKFVKQFEKLIINGFRESDFPREFYIKLSSCFGHIAHYDRGGFWYYWFISRSKQIEFIKHTLNAWVSGDPACTYSDVEKYIQSQSYLREKLIKLKVVEEKDREDAEYKEYIRLKAKYEDKNG